jgi:thiosulfate reductase cytochrome b subunit
MRTHDDIPAPGGRISVYRHAGLVRVTHWINALCVFVLILSGLNILKAHPALYWGSQSDFADPWLRVSTWLQHLPTLPTMRDLATGRNYHFFFAWVLVINGAAYLGYGIWRKHFARDLVPTRAEWGAIVEVAREHAKFHFPHERRYNVIQQLTYLAIIFGLLPLVVLSGLAMSPAFDAIAPWVLDFFGGRQSARTVHFLCAVAIVLFIFVHVALVVVSGFKNNIVSMITGRYVVERAPDALVDAPKATPAEAS